MARDNVKLLITVQGWQIVGEITDEDDSFYTVSKPVNIVQHPDPSQNGKLVFMPYLQLAAGDECTFDKKDVMHVLTPIDALVNDWDKQFGSGLDIPNQQIILE